MADRAHSNPAHHDGGPFGPAHLDPTVLAEHAEGLLPRQRTAEVADHLRVCLRCQAVLDGLTVVSTHLAAAPREVAVPAAVEVRITAALADERARQLAGTAAVAPAAGATGAANAAGALPGDARPSRARATLDSWRARLRDRAPAVLVAATAVGAIAFGAYAAGGGFSSPAGDDSVAGVTTAEQFSTSREDTDADSADAAESDEAAADLDAGRATDGAMDDADSAEAMEALVPAQLSREIQAIASGRASGPAPATADDGCGDNLAAELGQRVVGAATTDLIEPGSVLVVVTTDDIELVQGWVLPACDGGIASALATELTGLP